MSDKAGEFLGPEELRDLLERIGLRLHAQNRIAGGESVFLWLLAETIRAAGRLALATTNAPHLEILFGDGYAAGSIPKGDELDRFLAILKEELT